MNRGLITPGRIRSLRNKVGLSQSKFANYLGVDAAAVSGWESGRFSPNGTATVLILELEKKVDEKLTETGAQNLASFIGGMALGAFLVFLFSKK